jgi:hypothetical protein
VLTLVLYAFLALVAVGVLYGIALLFLARTEQISPPARDRAPWSLTSEPLRAEDVVSVRLPVALRGYRFAETDLLLDRLTEELRLRDEEIARLHSSALGLRSPFSRESDTASDTGPLPTVSSPFPPDPCYADYQPPAPYGG